MDVVAGFFDDSPAAKPQHPLWVKATRYFKEQVLRKRPYLRLEWIASVLRSPHHTEPQEDGRVRFWGYIEELGAWLRVVTLEDRETVHNAFPDRRYGGPRT